MPDDLAEVHCPYTLSSPLIKQFFLQVTAVHKANIMKLGDGLFLRSCEEISQLYPNIKFDAMIIDNTSMQVSGTVRTHLKTCQICALLSNGTLT